MAGQGYRDDVWPCELRMQPAESPHKKLSVASENQHSSSRRTWSRLDVSDATATVTSLHPVWEKYLGEAVCASLLPQPRVGAALPVAEIQIDGTRRVA